jgi:hypothetical protein
MDSEVEAVGDPELVHRSIEMGAPPQESNARYRLDPGSAVDGHLEVLVRAEIVHDGLDNVLNGFDGWSLTNAKRVVPVGGRGVDRHPKAVG